MMNPKEIAAVAAKALDDKLGVDIALLEITDKAEEAADGVMDEEERAALIQHLEDQMLDAAGSLDFEKAAKLRDKLFEIKGQQPVNKPQPQRRKRNRGK